MSDITSDSFGFTASEARTGPGWAPSSAAGARPTQPLTLIVHRSPELTMLYARIPPRFQSGIHDHTIFACIGQLRGEEIDTSYVRDGEKLRVAESQTARLGVVLELPPDVIHDIANPGDETAHALHLYGGDLPGLAEEHKLWAAETHAEQPFTFPALLEQSVAMMRQRDNGAGLSALVEAMPLARQWVDAG